MRLLFLLLALSSLPARAETGRFDPASQYVTAGQDEPGYRRWVAAVPWRSVYVKSFNDYLTANGVGGVAPTWQLLRTATDWQKCNAEPFEVPPTTAWPNIVAALRFVGAYVEPEIGPVEPVSVYRNPSLNDCAGGARESVHRGAGAVDMVPLHPVSRERLMSALCRIHLRNGSWNNIGLGFYKGLRFHIDAKKFREWGTAGARGGWGCTSVVAEGARPHVPAQPDAPPAATLSSGFKVVTMPPSPMTADPLAPKR